MLDDNTNIIERIKNQKEALFNWEKELKQILSERPKNSIRIIKFYIVKIEWLNNYIQTFFKGKKDYNNLIFSYKFNLINNDNFFNVTTIKELPRVYPLNEICWYYIIRDKNREKGIMFEGKVYNEILLSKIMNIYNCNVYSFFFLD